VVATMNSIGVDVRHHYRDINLQLVSTTDTKCPALLTPDGRPVPMAWLAQGGMQSLLIDYCTKRAVALEGTRNPKWLQACPNRFVTARNKATNAPDCWKIRAWIPGEGQNPIGSGLIDVSIPTTNKDWVTPEQKEHIATVVAVCNAAMSLQNAPRDSSTGLAFERVVAVSEFGELTHNEQLALFQGGIRRKLLQVDHLVLAP
jgi:hypothetical protein